jgi:hypothetical protein
LNGPENFNPLTHETNPAMTEPAIAGFFLNAGTKTGATEER